MNHRKNTFRHTSPDFIFPEMKTLLVLPLSLCTFLTASAAKPNLTNFLIEH